MGPLSVAIRHVLKTNIAVTIHVAVRAKQNKIPRSSRSRTSKKRIAYLHAFMSIDDYIILHATAEHSFVRKNHLISFMRRGNSMIEITKDDHGDDGVLVVFRNKVYIPSKTL